MLKIVEERPSAFKLQVLQNRCFYSDREVIRLESSEGNPGEIHVPAMQVAGDADIRLRKFFRLEMISGIVCDLPLLRYTEITRHLQRLNDLCRLYPFGICCNGPSVI